MKSNPTIPGPSGHILFGNIKEYKKDPLHCLVNWHQQYGDLIRFKIGPRTVYVFSHPKYIEQTLIRHPDIFTKMYDPKKPKGLAHVLGQGLVTSQGELWRKQRRLMQPVFQRGNTMTLIPKIQLAGIDMLKRWQSMPPAAEINVSDEMMKLTLEVITQTMFSTSVLNQVNEIAPALEMGLRYAAKTAINPLMPPLSIPTKSNRQFIKARTRLYQTIEELIEDRLQTGKQLDDLLDCLINAEDPETGMKMEKQQIRDEVTTIFSAGHETTANALTWTLYLLSRHPEVLQGIQQEIAEIDTETEMNPETLQQLSYTRAVLEESMRFRPPVGFVMRKIKHNIEIDGYSLKAPSLALFSIYNLHHHPEIWDQPERFKPDRFLNPGMVEKHAYMPFGAGERYCIGKHFAMTEALVLLTMILKHHRLTPVDKSQPTMEMAVTIRPKGGLKMRLHAM